MSLTSRLLKLEQGRRNLTDGWKYNLAQTRKAVLVDIAKAKKVEDGKKARDKQLGVLSIVDNTPVEPKHNTREVIADELGWSTGKVAMADREWKEAKPVTLYATARMKSYNSNIRTHEGYT